MCGFSMFTPFLQIVNLRTTKYFMCRYFLSEKLKIFGTFDVSKIATIIFAFITG